MFREKYTSLNKACLENINFHVILNGFTKSFMNTLWGSRLLCHNLVPILSGISRFLGGIAGTLLWVLTLLSYRYLDQTRAHLYTSRACGCNRNPTVYFNCADLLTHMTCCFIKLS